MNWSTLQLTFNRNAGQSRRDWVHVWKVMSHAALRSQKS